MLPTKSVCPIRVGERKKGDFKSWLALFWTSIGGGDQSRERGKTGLERYMASQEGSGRDSSKKMNSCRPLKTRKIEKGLLAGTVWRFTSTESAKRHRWEEGKKSYKRGENAQRGNRADPRERKRVSGQVTI